MIASVHHGAFISFYLVMLAAVSVHVLLLSQTSQGGTSLKKEVYFVHIKVVEIPTSGSLSPSAMSSTPSAELQRSREIGKH